MSSESKSIHLIAGGIAGTTGAVLTCPLEVVKTRLQSSVAVFGPTNPMVVTKVNLVTTTVPSAATYTTCTSMSGTQSVNLTQSAPRPAVGLVDCLRQIVKHEGQRGLFKGLGPNLVGVAPSRAIYFCTYANVKAALNETIPPDTPLVHILSAMSAGFMASTITNPIWFVKTRVQLDQKRKGHLTAFACVKHVYQEQGVRGFYKGITASYYGISETVIHFVIYEFLKAKIREMKGRTYLNDTNRTLVDFLEFMGCGATSKTIASCIAYPHEVVRTRLRQEGAKYRNFWQTVGVILREEGWPSLYRGLCTQLVRQIPNTAIMMSTYELVVFLYQKHFYEKHGYR